MSTDDARTPVDPLAEPRTVRMVRRFGAPPPRLYRCLTDPEELVRWFPERIEGSIAVHTRSTLVFPNARRWWDIDTLESDRRLVVRWAWLPGDAWITTVTIALEPAGYGTLLTLTDGPFDLRVPGAIDAYAEAREGWAEALAWLRGYADFSVELRPRRY
ncbi:MAG: SRPBCC domain-containing protein [Chloroflexi bacterium]|nr:SRPBCC domain-containing protein [Chloroflexota bacterium]